MINRQRAFIPILFIALAFTVVTVRLFAIQVWHHEDLNKRVQKLVFRDKPETPCRGTIYDKHDRVLATSIKTYTLFADAAMLRDPARTEKDLKALGITFDRRLLSPANRSSYIPLARHLDYGKVKKIKALKIAGLGFTPGYDRQYPESRMASHVLGLVGKDNTGLEGIEYSYNSYLSGEKVKQTRYRDGRGREISERLAKADELRGADVHLTIDRNLQFIAEQEIDKAWKQSQSKKAMLIIQDPHTGEILALACRPNFDPADFSGSWDKIKNPAVSDIFEPGSTFKAITAAAALEEKVAKRSEVIWCEEGKYKLYGHTINDHEKKGLLTFDEIMEHSSNIGVAKISQRLGKDKLYQYIRQFGFNSVTGIDLPGEARGLLKEPERWSGLSLPIISFGQEIGVTALQMINAYSALFNGGSLMEPRIIDSITSPSGEKLFQSEKRVVRKAISSEVAAQVKDMMQGIVENGTGQMAKVPFYSVGGKTGTAQKRDPVTKKYSSSCYVASFCGAIPVSDPRMTILVVLDEPKGDYWASSRAAPVFNKVAARAVSYLQISPDQKPFNLAKNK